MSLALPALAVVAASHPQVQKASSGKVDRHYVYSPEMGDTIIVDVWTPEGYSASAHRYPVIYMHDGQNLFDASTTWNGQAWEMDSVASLLIDKGEICAPVIVGVHSVASTRVGDLMPENVKDYVRGRGGKELQGFLTASKLRGNAYATFLVNTLRPEMNAIYNLAESADSTFVMGSSMGGLMSVYAMSEYPEVFGAAACLSTHWVGTVDGDPTFAEAMYEYLSDRLPRDGRHRLYLDRGTASLDSLYGPADRRMIDLARRLGYAGSRFESYVDSDAGHEERYWAARVARPLRFLLPR